MKTNKKLLTKSKILVFTPILLAVIAAGGSRLVRASHLNGQITELNTQNAQNQQAQDGLEVQETDLNGKIERLQSEINAIQALIQENQIKNDQLKVKIAEVEAELEEQKGLLGQNIRAMYIEGDISTLEMLASSQNLSEFVDKQQYRTSVQSKITATLDKITELKHQLSAQQEELQKLIDDHKKMQARVAEQKDEQNSLLGLNQQQQADYNQKIASNNSQLSKLRSQQIAENAQLFGGGVTNGIPGGGGYPARWANLPIDSVFDSWGMYNRECVSYTAWKVASTGRYMPYWGGRGNANSWDDNARAAGIPTDSSPRPGDVAVSNSGFYGHTMYVEKVSGDGSIYVSDYNQQLDGNYREYWISGSTVRARGLVFIHF